jgi:hypothetical protein
LVDGSHETDLPSLFFRTGLINAESVNPDAPCPKTADIGEKPLELFVDGNFHSVDGEECGPGAPDIRHGDIIGGVAKGDSLQGCRKSRI